MFSKALRRAVASLLVLSLLGGCAEINRRGGIVDQIEDLVLFRADTKSHRLWRSYLLVGALLAAARRDPRNEIDQAAIAGNLVPALAIANEAFYCLYPGTQEKVSSSDLANLPAEIAINWSLPVATTGSLVNVGYEPPRWCQFFDERMARLDYAIYRLALTTLFSSEGQKYLADIRDQMIGKIPVLSDAGRAALYANKVVGQTSNIIDDLLNLTFKSLGPTVSLLPLYRDALEINMIVVINTLQIRCDARINAGQQSTPARLPESAYTSTERPVSDGVVLAYDAADSCKTLAHALTIFNRGNGNISHWRAFLREFDGDTQTVEAYRPHFLLVTQLMVRSCKVLLASAATGLTCNDVLKSALEQTAFNIDNPTGKGTDTTGADGSKVKRQLTATLFPMIQTASTRQRVRIVRPASSAPDAAATGSIPQRSPAPAAPQPAAPPSAAPAR